MNTTNPSNTTTTPVTSPATTTTPASTTAATTATTTATTRPISTTPASTTAVTTRPTSTTTATTAATSTTRPTSTTTATTPASTTKNATAKPTIASVEDNTLGDIFSKSNVIFILWFLAIYFVIYLILGIFFAKSDTPESSGLRITRIIDGLVFIMVLMIIGTSFSNSKTEDTSVYLSNSLSDFKKFAENPYSIFSVIIFLVVFYSCIYLFRIPMADQTKPISILIIESIALILVAILLIHDFFKYVLKINLLDLILNGWIDWFKKPEATTTPPATTAPGTTTTPATCITTSPADSPEGKEVFNIRNNLYTYDEAKSVCSIYGAKLATYKQIEDAYNGGAEWCNYGWSDGQMALFPTQYATWQKLQDKAAQSSASCSDKNTTVNACGRPGINGGFIKNKNVRFGVNCFGKKPKPTTDETNMMNANIEDKIPESPADIEMKAKMDVWKKNSDKFLVLNSFNRKDWSEY